MSCCDTPKLAPVERPFVVIELNRAAAGFRKHDPEAFKRSGRWMFCDNCCAFTREPVSQKAEEA